MQAITTQQYKTLAIKIDNEILTITLQRPQKKNAMNFLMMRELIYLGAAIQQDRNLRAVIIKGAQDTFCAGIDLNDLNNPKQKLFALWELIKPLQSQFQRVCLLWRDLPVPVIAAIEGHCIGAGLQLALGCDIRIATPNAKLSIMEAKWGLVPDMGLSQSALGVVTADVLKQLAMTAQVISGDEALKFGVITQVATEPYNAALDVCAKIIDRSPDAVLASKRLINKMYVQPYRSLYYEKQWQIKLMLGRNRKQAIKKAKGISVAYFKRQFG